MELIKENIQLNDVIVNASAQKSVDGDIIVPDSKPDILKILQVDAVLGINEREISDGRLKINGRVDLKILYIPDSETECIKSILTSFDFEEEILNKNISDGDFAMLSGNVERVEFSLINSRKLKIKSIVEFDYEIIRIKLLEPTVDIEAENEEKIEIKRQPTALRRSLGIDEFSFDVRNKLSVPSGQGVVNEILKADYSIKEIKYTPVEGRLMLEGAVGVCILYTDNDGKVEFCEGELSFAEVCDMDKMNENAECEIECRINDGIFEVKEDSDGDLREIMLSADITAQIKAWENIETDMITDCFAAYRKTVTESETVSTEEILSRPSSQNTIREIIEMSNSLPGVLNVYNAVTRPYITNVGFERNKLICEGNLEICVLYVSDSTENPVYSIKKNIPFSYSLDCDTAANYKDAVPKIKAEVKHTGYNLNAAGEIEIRCILSLTANVTHRKKIKMITSVEAVGDAEPDENQIIIYFVQPDDDLWSVSKKYRVPCENIRKFNNIQEEDFKIGMRLLIPGK